MALVIDLYQATDALAKSLSDQLFHIIAILSFNEGIKSNHVFPVITLPPT